MNKQPRNDGLKNQHFLSFFRASFSVAILLASAICVPANAQILSPRQIYASGETCPGDYGGSPKFNCTSNDIDLTNVTISGAPASCAPGEMVTASFEIDLSANANIRYNAMIWISQNLVDPRTTGGGGMCFVSSVPDDDTTHIPELLFDDANVCADIDVPSNNYVLSGLDIGSVEFECTDSDNDGYADVPVLVTWSNQGGDACSAETAPDAGDGVYPINSTPAKCDADVLNTPIEVNTPETGLSLDKTTTTSDFNSVGDTIDYEFEVTNTGDETLTCPIVIDDDKATNENCPATCDNDATTTDLEPDESVTCTASYNVTQTDLDNGFVQNFATASSSDQPPVDSNQDTVTVNGVFTVVNLVKDLNIDSGGTAVESDFDLVLTGDDGTHGSGVAYHDPDGNGVSVNVSAGVEYFVSELQMPYYTLTGISCLDDENLSDVGTTFTLSEGQSVTCTFSNDDIPQLTPFRIKKIWDQAGETDGIPVTGHLSCTGAFTTQQDVVFTATTDAILFVYDIALIPEGQQVDCTVTEDVPEGYRARYRCDEGNCADSEQGLDYCFWSNVDADGSYLCTITNRPLPAVMDVTKTWVIEGADQGFRGDYCIHANCTSPVRGGEIWGCNVLSTDSRGPEEISTKIRLLGPCFATACISGALDATFGFTIVKPNYPATRCQFWEETRDQVIESEGCEGYWRLGANAQNECEIVNTVFFEGIPTLNRYGMAMLALLMLGIGFVGFRRLN